jgi:hypothetical protein
MASWLLLSCIAPSLSSIRPNLPWRVCPCLSLRRSLSASLPRARRGAFPLLPWLLVQPLLSPPSTLPQLAQPAVVLPMAGTFSLAAALPQDAPIPLLHCAARPSVCVPCSLRMSSSPAAPSPLRILLPARAQPSSPWRAPGSSFSPTRGLPSRAPPSRLPWRLPYCSDSSVPPLPVCPSACSTHGRLFVSASSANSLALGALCARRFQFGRLCRLSSPWLELFLRPWRARAPPCSRCRLACSSLCARPSGLCLAPRLPARSPASLFPTRVFRYSCACYREAPCSVLLRRVIVRAKLFAVDIESVTRALTR